MPVPYTSAPEESMARLASRVGRIDASGIRKIFDLAPVSYTHLTLPTIYSV